MSRKVEDLTGEMQLKYSQFCERMKTAKIDWILTCTRRTQDEQTELWKKGRALNANGQWYVVDPKRCVTWTLNSRHLTGTAFDICIMQNGKPMWNAELDTDKDGVPEYTEAGIIGESIGLKWGGRFLNSKGKPIPDAPHFEL